MKQAWQGFLFVVASSLWTNVAWAADPYQAIVAGASGGCAFEVMSLEAAWLPRGSYPATAVAASPMGGVRATVSDVGGFHIEEIGFDGSARRLSATVADRDGFGIAADRAGNTFVLAAERENRLTGDGLNAAIVAFDPAGNVSATYELGPGYVNRFNGSVSGMDLAADQCTLFLESNGVVRRFNVCTGTFLADFAMISEPFWHHPLRILPDGGLLVGFSDRMERYSAAGVRVRTYPGFARGAMTLTRGGSVVWIARTCRHEIVEVDLETGATRHIGEPGVDMPISMVANLGWTAVLGASHVAGIPTASTVTLAFLAVALVLAAFLRMS